MPAEAYGRRGFHVLEQDGGGRTEAYWDDFVEASRGRDAIVVWNGNQHWQFLFQQSVVFDLIDDVEELGSDTRFLVPRRLVKAYFEPTVVPLNSLVQRIRNMDACSVTVVGTPPPPKDMFLYDRLIRESSFFKDVALHHGLDIETIKITPVTILLKLWRVIQDLLAESALSHNATFLAVEKPLVDDDGYLAEDYRIPHDFTHANAEFGQMMLRQALQA